ncbi:MAG: type VI secretion system baseplate subunit TssG [Gammaproteobacteria bacterium]|nr:type VI secretion system baseplate subunit TssG [Gammaproteobacteria bacterium]
MSNSTPVISAPLQLPSLAPATDFFVTAFVAQRHLRRHLGLAAVGEDADPKREALRFRVTQSLDHGSVAVRRTSSNAAGQLELQVAHFGLTGPSGVMPLHYRELVMERVRHKDTALRDFLDLFNHRLLSLLYRSWSKYRLATDVAEYGCGLEGRFARAMASLSGARTPLELYMGGLLQRPVRSAATLRALLAEVLGVPVQVREWQGAWLTLAADEQSRLTSRARPEGQHARLGEAMLGSRAWDVAAGFDIELTLNQRRQWQEFRLGGARHALAEALVKRFVGCGWRYRIVLDLPRRLLSPAVLGGQTALGHGDLLSASQPSHSGNCLFSLRPSGRAASMKGTHDVHHDPQITG